MPSAGFRQRVAGAIDLRPGEFRRLAPLTLAYALVLMSVYVLKPVRNALFLDSLGISQLPYVLLLVAGIGGVSASLFSRFARSVRLDRLITFTFLFLLTNLVGFRILLPGAGGWAYYLFYVWVNLYGLTAISLLWLLANTAFNAREARRVFGLIGSGGIAGAILGGTFTGWAVRFMGSENLLFVCMGLLAACTVLVRMVREAEPTAARSGQPAGGAIDSLGRYALLRWLGLMAGMVSIVAAIADVQFNQIADSAFATRDAKTAFFGTFFAYLNGFNLLFQVFVTPRILGGLGVGVALLFLPLSLGAGSAAVLLLPGLVGGVAVKIGDVGFRHSVHRSAAEILFLPLPTSVKQRSKMFLDTAVDSMGTGLGALLVLVLTGWLGMSYPHLGLLSLCLVSVWLCLLPKVRRAYLDAFRLALDRQEIDPTEVTVGLSEAGVSQALLATLTSENPRQVAYALDLLTSTRATVPVDTLRSLLSHPVPEVRRNAARASRNADAEILTPDMTARMSDSDPDVCMAAMAFICRNAPEGAASRLSVYLSDPDPVVRATAVGCAMAYGDDEQRALVDKDVLEALLLVEGEAGTFARQQAARAVRNLPDPSVRDMLHRLKQDPSQTVVRAAIESVGSTGDQEHVPWLLERLTDRRTRREARSALASMGEAAVTVLTESLDDASRGFRARLQIPRVLGDMAAQVSVDVLLERLGALPGSLEQGALKAANRLRIRSSELRFEPATIDTLLFDRARRYYELTKWRSLLGPSADSPSRRLLSRALTEKHQRCLEEIFRLLGLRYHPDDIYNAYLGFVSGVPAVKASAVEFLDNLVARHLKDFLFPILDPASTEAGLEEGRRLFGACAETAEDALGSLIDGEDAWLRVCAIHSLDAATPLHLVARAVARTDDADEVVAEEVRAAECRLADLLETRGGDADGR